MPARVTLVANDPSSPPSGLAGIHNAMASADGRFRFTDLAPGPYLISASATEPSATPQDRPHPLSTVADLDVPTDGVPAVSLVLQEGFTVTGSIRVEGSSPPPNLESLRVLLQPAQNLTTVSISTGGQSTSTDGHFTLTGISPGRYHLTLLLPSQIMSTWRVRSATLLGQDSLDDGVDLRAGTNDAVIVLSDRLSDLSGKVEAPAGGTPDYTMILFPTDRAQWRARSRRVMTARVATDGGFSFRNVPPGDYLLAPVDDVEPGEWFDPAFLQGLAPAAIHVTIAEGEKKVQDIRVGAGGA
jgi:hypothetical protein